MGLGAIALLAVFAGASRAGEPAVPSFAVRAPDKPLELRLSSPACPAWGHTPELRLIYYAAEGVVPNDLDRETILRELRVIQDFYAHFGLIVRVEPRVYEVRVDSPKEPSVDDRDYFFVKKQIQDRGLYAQRRTVVFATFDSGRGGGLALTGLNDANVRERECPRPSRGDAWWCGYPEAAHWGGCVHEVGHMFGLAHPDTFTASSPYLFSDGKTKYVYDERDGDKAVMERHDRFFRHPDNGLLPHELDALYRKYHDDGAAPPSLGSRR